MNTACREFCDLLEERLDGRPNPSQLARLERLDWHWHLRGCTDCRELFEAEEALEILLASLPEPKLPPSMARRVLSRLRREREADAATQPVSRERLDVLLELDPGAHLPAGLASRVLAGIDARTEAALDRLLDEADDAAVPAGLSERVLEGLASERRVAQARSRFFVLRSPVMMRAAAIMLACGAAFGAWRLLQGGAPDLVVDATDRPAVSPFDTPENDLLACLDILEHFDEVTPQNDLDLQVSAIFDSVDEALLIVNSDR